MYVTTLLNYLLLMSLHVLLYLGALFGQFQQILPAVLSFHIQQTLLLILKDLGTQIITWTMDVHNLPKFKNKV